MKTNRNESSRVESWPSVFLSTSWKDELVWDHKSYKQHDATCSLQPLQLICKHDAIQDDGFVLYLISMVKWANENAFVGGRCYEAGNDNSTH